MGKQAQDCGLIEQTLNKCFEETPACKLIAPEDAEFASATPEAHRKGEKAYHVKAFRGNKDGKHARRHTIDIRLKEGRIPILSRHWYILRLQKATRVFPV